MLSKTIREMSYPDEYPNYFKVWMPVDKDFQISLKLEEKKYLKSATILKYLGIFFFFGVKCHYLNKQKV